MKILLLTNVSINNPFICHAKNSEIETDDAIANELIEKGYASKLAESKKATRKKATRGVDATATDSESEN